MKKYFNIIFLLFILSIFIKPAFSAASKPFRMLSANRISGMIPDIEDGYGVSFRDFNNDGYPDIYLVCFRNLNRLLINNGGIIPFIDRTIYSGLGGNLMPRGRTNLELGSNATDYDNDGLPDIFIAGWGKSHALFHNDGKLKFSDVTTNLNLREAVDANQGLWLDVNNDGYLDLYITDEHHPNRLLINEKNGSFREAPWSKGFRDSSVSQGACGADFDGDGDEDIYVCNWFSADYLLANNGRGQFERVRLNLPTLQENISTNSAAWGDVDNDGDVDLLIAGQNGKVYFYKNSSTPQQMRFEQVTDFPFAEPGQSVYGILLEDFNQDGWLDCFLAIKGANRLYLNNGRGGFCDFYDTDGNQTYSTGCAAADLDADGDLDVFVANKNALSQIYLNPVNNKHFLKLRLKGVRSNREALGSKIWFYAADDSARPLLGYREVRSQVGYLSSAEPVVHFGTGAHTLLALKIIFPSGKVIEKNNLYAGRSYLISEFEFLPGSFYTFAKTFRFYARQKIFWLNLFLIFFLIGLIYLFTRSGLRRYRWSAVQMSTLFIIWFIFTVIVLLALRNFSTVINLLAVNAVALSGVVLSGLYSEYNLRLRRKRQRFRGILQNFSNRMITIHGNATLFKEMQKTFMQHPGISRVLLLRYNSDKSLTSESEGQGKRRISMSGLEQKLRRKNIFYAYENTELKEIFNTFKANVLIPVGRGKELWGLLALQMENIKSAINQEDIRLLLPITNQLAIAIENNNYIEESARLVKQLTEAEVRARYTKQLEESNLRLDEKNAELTRLFRELQEKESQLVHSEKMASLGQLVAGISHELNNPISFLYANSKALQEYLQDLQTLWEQSNPNPKGARKRAFEKIMADLKAIITDNLQGSKNVKELVQNLRNFSRLDQAARKKASLVEGLESSLKILKPQIPENVKIKKDFRADPLILCNPGQMNQVFVNLIGNALQAVGKENGKIILRTLTLNQTFLIQVQDNGNGIPKENLPRIFEPFFTTKDVNQGTGLGLSISYSIVQRHGGRLTVESAEGQGSTFTVRLPLRGKEDE